MNDTDDDESWLYFECGMAVGGAISTIREVMGLSKYRTGSEYPDHIQALLNEAQDRLYDFAKYLKNNGDI